MKTKKRLLVGLLALVVLLSLTLAFVACTQKEPEVPPFTPQGEEAVYYRDGANGEETIELKNGNFVLKLAGDNKSGTYKYAKGSDGKGEITLTFSDSSNAMGSLNVNTGVFEILYGGTPYSLIKKVNYVVSYDVDGGSSIAPTETLNGRGISRPADPTKAGYIFAGWYTDAAKTTAYNFKSGKITADTTLYAKFVEKTDGTGEFTVQLINGESVLESRVTNNGLLHNLPELQEDGKVFLGWWISDSRDASKLTRQYTDSEKIEENTNLYAVWAGDTPAISVYNDKIVWNEVGTKGTVYHYSVNHTGGYLETTKSDDIVGTSFNIDFSKEPIGEYEISVTVNGKTSKAYYVNKGLARVSLFEVHGNDLVFNKVANATEYFISVKCGDPSHKHEEESLGESSTYNFANCQIGANGYEFTVKATAEGYVESVSDVFVYNRSLGQLTGLTRDTTTETLSWTKVEGATSYIVRITVGGETVEKTVYTESIFMGDYRGDITAEVISVAFGYQSTSEVITYTNTRLPAPTNIKVSGSTITWDAVEGATGYVVSIDGKEFATTTNSMTMSDQHFVQGQKEYKISIRANASNAKDNSMYSEEFTAKYGVMGDRLSYENNVLSWDAVFGAVKYVITINAGTESQEEIEITDGSISAVITWPKAGENTVSVYCVDKDGEKSTEITIKVTTYEIKFETGENAVPVEPMYKAIGDEYELPEAMANGLAFQGWYDNADYQSAKRYDDKGIMTGNMVVYAGWTKEQYVVTLDVGELGTLEEEFTTAKVIYGEKYVLPVPKSTDSNKVFAGWYTEPRGAGRRYTDQTGASIGGYPQASGRILYASWVDVFEFTVYNNPNTGLYDSIAVSAGPGISFVTEITIPSSYTGTLTYLETYTDDMGNPQLREVTQTGTWKVARISNNAFKSCTTLVKINIPSTIELVAWSGEGANYSDGAFSGCSKIEAYFVYDVNDPTKEAVVDEDTVYWSKDGVLYINDKTSGEVEVHSWPYNKQDSSFTVPYGVTNIPQYTFRGARFTLINLSASVRKLNKYSFYSCSNLTTIVFLEPEEGQTAGGALELTSGDNAAIYSCNKLKTIVFPKRLKTFDGETLKSCSNLSAILIGADGAELGDNYASIVFTDDNNQIIGSIITNRTKTTLIYVPRGFLGSDLFDDEGNDIGDALRIPNGISTIAEYALGGTSSTYACKFTHVYIPGTVTVIEENAFKYCTKMTDVIFEGEYDDPDLKICSFAFSNCTGLTEITLPANLTVLEAFAFAATSKLTTVYVNTHRDYVEYETGAFAATTSTGSGIGTYYVTHVTLGPNVPVISIQAVFGNTKLQSVKVHSDNMFYRSDEEGVVYNRSMTRLVYFPDGKTSYEIPTTVKEIESETFREKNTLESIVIHAGISKIGSNAFYGCGALNTVTFLKTEEGATPVELIIDEGAFYDCVYLTAIEIPARTTTIGDQAFRSCTRLASITFEATPASMTEKPLTIGIYAFAQSGNISGGPNLNFIDLPDRTTEIGNLAFYNCQYLTSIDIPANVTKMGYYVKQSVYVHGVDSQGNETVSAEMQERDVLVSMSVFYNCYRLESINVDPANKYFMSIDGVLYSKEYISVKVTNYLHQSTSQTNPTPYYSVQDSNFYDNTDGTAKALLVCPAGNSGTNGIMTIPNTVMALWYNAFYYNGYATYHSEDVGIAEIKFSKDYIENNADNKLDIHNNVFYYCKKLQSVSLPRGLETIAKQMFYYCESLESITIPNTVQNIATQAFYSCTALHTVNFEDVAEGETAVPLLFEEGTSSSGVFSNCSALTTITLPERTTSIEKYVFKGSSIEEIGLPSTLETIKPYAFASLASLKKVTFPNGLQETTVDQDGNVLGLIIYDNAFYSSSKLETIQLPEGIIGIGYYAFNGCTALQEINLPASLRELGTYYSSPTSTSVGYVFNNCISLTTVTFGNIRLRASQDFYLEVIPKYTFANCSSLLSIEIPASVKELGEYVFSGCTKLASITFGTNSKGENHLEKIGNYAFQRTAITSFAFPESTASTLTLGTELFKNCLQLTDVYLSSNIAVIDGVFKGCDSISNMTVAEDNPNFKAYTSPTGEQLPILVSKNNESIKFIYADLVGEFKIPEGFLYIEENAFANQELLTKIVIPNSLLEIGKYAFAYCTELKTVEFGNLPQLKKIGDYAFQYTAALETFVVPSHAEMALGTYVFAYSGIKEFSFAGTVASIGNYAFTYTENLEKFTMPNNSELTVGTNLFRYSGIEEFTFAGNVKSIGQGMFQYCENLTKVTGWPESVKTTPTYLFSGCTSLTSFTISKDVEAIGNYMFGGSSESYGSGIESITIPSTVKTIGTYMFGRCYNLKSVVFEENKDITALGNDMFYYCTGLETVDLSPLKSVSFLGKETFAFSGIREIEIPETVESLNNTATATTVTTAANLFKGCENLEKVALHDKITYIGAYVFNNCTNLTTVTTKDHSNDETPFVGVELPAELLKIGNYAFANCSSITSIDTSAATKLNELGNYAFSETGIKSFAMPAAITTFGTYVFNKCYDLETVTFDANCDVKTLGNGMFQYCTSLKSANIEVLSKLTYLGTYTFRYSGIESIKMPDNLKQIGSSATSCTTSSSSYVFAYCERLKTVDLNNVAKVGAYTFAYCYALEEVIGLENVTLLGNSAFRQCGKVVTKELEDGTVVETGEITGLKSVKFGAKMTGTAYGSCVFAECVNLETVVIEQGTLTYFGSNSTTSTTSSYGIFQACTKLTNVTIPANITKITSSAFRDCTSLKNVDFLNTSASVITEIGSYAFAGSGVETVDLSKLTALTKIGNYAFNNASSLKNLTLPNSKLTTISSGAFYLAKSITSLVLPNTVTTIQSDAFNNAGTFTTLNIPASVTSIGNGAFSGLHNLTAFTVDANNKNYRAGSSGELIKIEADGDDLVTCVPGGFTGVFTFEAGTAPGSYCFINCSKVTGAVLPQGITEIADYAFAYLRAETVVLPDTVTTIGNYAFRYSYISYIDIPSSVTHIGYEAFAYTSNLKSIVIPESVETLGQYFIRESGVESVTFNGTVKFVNSNMKETTSAYIVADNTSDAKSVVTLKELVFNNTEKEIWTELPGYTLYYVRNSNFRVEIPDTVTVLGNYSTTSSYFMYYCKGNVIDMKLPQGLTEIGASFVYVYLSTTGDNSALRNVWKNFVLPAGVTTIGNYAFNGIDFGSTFDWNNAPVTTLGNYVFQYCKFDGEFTFPATVKSIGTATFQYAEIEKFILPTTLESSGAMVSGEYGSRYYQDYTFRNAKIGEFVFAEGIKVIGSPLVSSTSYGMFYYASIGKITLPSTLEKINQYAFGYLGKQSSGWATEQMVIPEGVTDIGTWAFYSANIKNLYLPKSLVVVDGSYVWASWTEEQTIYFPISYDKAMNIASEAINLASNKAVIIYDFDEEIPEVVWPPVEEETPEEEPTV